MADTNIETKTSVLSHDDMEIVLTSIRAYVDTLYGKVSGDAQTVANLLNIILGDDMATEGETQKSLRAISAEEVAKIVANAPEAFDTLKEIADWIGSGDVANTTAADMLARIAALEGKFSGDESVETLIENAKQLAISAAASDATGKVNALSNTAVSSESTSGPVKVSLGGRVGAPTVAVEVEMATAAEVETLCKIFQVEES